MTAGRRLLLATGIAIVGGCVFVDEPCACSPTPSVVVPVSGTIVEASGARASGVEVRGRLYDGECPATSDGPTLVDLMHQRSGASGTFRFELRDFFLLDSGCVRVTAHRDPLAAPAVTFTQQVRVGLDAAGRPFDSVRVTLTLPAR